MKQVMCCGLAVLALSASMAAQDHKMDSMKSEMSYTGCLERNPAGMIELAHFMAADEAGKKSMSKEPMAKDSMAHDSMMKDSMTLALSSTSVDLAKHVGHKVTVTGAANDMDGTKMFSVTSMKMVASSCK